MPNVAQGSGSAAGKARQVTYGPQPVSVWAADILSNIGAPHTQNNVNNLAAWWSCETGAAWGYGDTRQYNNLLNTAQFSSARSGWVPNSFPPGIPQFPNYNTGLWATLMTLRMPRYAGVIGALRSDANRAAFASEVGSSGWGTNGQCIAGSTASAGIVAGTGLRPAGPVGGFRGSPAGQALASAGSGCAPALILLPWALARLAMGRWHRA